MIPASWQCKLIKMLSFLWFVTLILCHWSGSPLRVRRENSTSREDSYKNSSSKWIFLKIYFKSHFNQPHHSTCFQLKGAKQNSNCSEHSSSIPQAWMALIALSYLLKVGLLSGFWIALLNYPGIVAVLKPSPAPFLFFRKFTTFLFILTSKNRNFLHDFTGADQS